MCGSPSFVKVLGRQGGGEVESFFLVQPLSLLPESEVTRRRGGLRARLNDRQTVSLSFEMRHSLGELCPFCVVDGSMLFSLRHSVFFSHLS